jgi:hypothetical protein
MERLEARILAGGQSMNDTDPRWLDGRFMFRWSNA